MLAIVSGLAVSLETPVIAAVRVRDACVSRSSLVPARGKPV
jgi:hypothetical protein